MSRETVDRFLTWLLLPAALALVTSALTLSSRAYTGLSLSQDRVVTVQPGSPGEHAGILPGDRLFATGASRSTVLTAGPLERARPGRPVVVQRSRDGETTTAWLVPSALPESERRFRAFLFGVASVFLLLGGWVWSERRDPVTRVFLLLCLAFAGMLAQAPVFGSPLVQLASDLAVLAAQLYAPVLFAHLFALFPEPLTRGRAAWVLRIGYAVATVLFVAWLACGAEGFWGAGRLGVLLPALLALPGLHFGLGVVAGIALFARSFLRARSPDARRRLRVVFLGTVLGAAPFATLVALRNLAPDAPMPGERAIVGSVLLVPASFAWAIAVHRVFDFRVALRAVVSLLLVVLAGCAMFAAGEWLAQHWWPELGRDVSGVSLAFLALVAGLAGPSRPWISGVGARMVPIADEVALGAWAPSEAVTRAGAEIVLAEACEIVRKALRLEGCSAVFATDDGVHVVPPPRLPLLRALGGHFPASVARLDRPHAVSDLSLPEEDRELLDMAAVQWLIGVPGAPAPTTLLLGRRLAGPWLDRHETRELSRFVQVLGVSLENASLRVEARGRAALDRELEEAHRVQLKRLPRRTPVYPTLDCAASTLATESVGGDYYDFIQEGARDFTLAVGDAAGHGVPAALVLAGVQSRFRDEAQRARHPGELLEALNRDLVALEQPEKFMALLCARVDAAAGTIAFSNAGITPPIVRRTDGAVEEWRDSGLLLGVSAEARYGVSTVTLGPGELAVVYTDGLTEAARDGEMFGGERVAEVLDRVAHRRAADIVEELMQAVRNWATEPLDDLTIVVLKQLTGPARVRSGLPLKSGVTTSDT
ncbi:MAG: SpoIIE family protein phosphatase [Candidatus Eisenbacteria bacterium]|nr:SpoIIE family protein phosphatase [Candidatus Eisenbacteria bacterium]